LEPAPCGEVGQEHRLAPTACSVPLDFVSVIALWWASSPLFEALLPAHVGAHGTGIGAGHVRRLLQRWRHHVDVTVLFGVLAALLLLDGHCRHSSPTAFENAEFGAVFLGVLSMLRRCWPMTWDGWRGPLEHLETVPGPDFTISQCMVCLSTLVSGEDICRTQCGHDFHRDCLEEWALSRRHHSVACPLCRKRLALPDSSDLCVCHPSLP